MSQPHDGTSNQDPANEQGTGNEQPFDVRASEQDTSGDMGVSSETEGHAGPGQHGVGGVRDVSPPDEPPADAPPEQSSGGVETNPDGISPKAGYSSQDPRSEEFPWKGIEGGKGPQDRKPD